MPGILSWTLTPPPAPAFAPVPEPSSASPELPCPMEAETQQGFLNLFDRLLPRAYLAPMKSGQGPGYELFQGLAAIGGRVSLAVARAACQSYLGSASGGARAVVTVQLLRTQPIPDGVTTVTVKAGTVLICSRSGRQFATQADVAFAPADLGPFDVQAQAIEVGYEYNVVGQRAAATGEVLPGEIDTISSLNTDPPFGDPTIQVVQIQDAAGGVAAVLDQLGADRGIVRRSGESDTAYRVRVKQLPDTVSLGAVKRAVLNWFAQWNHGAQVVEAWEPSVCMIGDLPPGVPGMVDSMGYGDDPRTFPPLANVGLDDVSFRGTFFVLVDNLEAIQDLGIYGDDPGLVPQDFVSPNTGGRRSAPYGDLPVTLTPDLLAGAGDGIDGPKQSVYQGLDAVLDAIKPAGVQYYLLMPQPGAVLFPL